MVDHVVMDVSDVVASVSLQLANLYIRNDVRPSKNQALCKFCTHVNQLKHC